MDHKRTIDPTAQSGWPFICPNLTQIFDSLYKTQRAEFRKEQVQIKKAFDVVLTRFTESSKKEVREGRTAWPPFRA